MDNLIIQGEKDLYFKPSVNFDANNGKLLIQGESYLEDTREFYFPLIKWIQNFIAEKKAPVTLEIDLSYYNTSSSKHILEILYILKEYENEDGDVTINWYYTEEDEDIEEEIKDFEIDSGLKINQIRKE